MLMAGKLVGRNKKSPEGRMNKGYLAETKGFEPLMGLNTPYSLSRGAPSATRSRFQRNDCMRKFPRMVI